MAAPIPKSGDLRVTTAPVPGADDASSQALSEALGSSLLLVRLLVVVLAVAFVFSCVFTVNPNEVAIVLRFGKPVGRGQDQIRKQGLHWAFPYPIDEIVKVRVGESKTLRATNTWHATTAEMEAQGLPPIVNPSLTPGVDGHVLTSDGNILHVRATLRYRIADPLAYTFRFTTVTNLLTSALDNSIHWASARFTADSALYKDRPAFRDAIKLRLTEQVERGGFGVTVDTLDVEVTAPAFVKEFFDQVISAEQDRSKLINDAQGEYDRITREAVGEASRVVAIGHANSNLLVQSVTADATFFRNVLNDYRANPALFRERRRIETIARVITNATDKFYQPAGVAELRLNLSAEPEAPRKAADPTANR
jgi:modulator of FtsH protease HflK